MIRKLPGRKSLKSRLAAVFFVILLIGCYSKETYVRQNSISNQRDHHRNISNKDIQTFLSSIKKIDGDLEAQYKQALYLQKKNKHKIAIAILKEVIEKDPLYFKAHNAMGISYDYLGNYNSAINSYKLALTINPDLDYVHNNLGYSHLLNGNLDSAINSFQKAIALNENNKRYHNNLGVAYAQKGQFDLAIEQFAFAGDQISANHKLSQILYQEGKYKLARRYHHKSAYLEAANNKERSTVASNKKKSSDYYSKIEEKYLEPTKRHSDLETSQDYFAKEKKMIRKNIPQNSIQKNKIGNSGDESIVGQITLQKPIEETTIQNDISKENFVISDSNNKKIDSLKKAIEKQKITSIQHSVEPEIEVSNGNGVNHMATRIGNYLRNKGLNVTLHTNADHFNYEETKIYYNKPHLHDSYKVAQQIPGWQNMQQVNKFSRRNIKIKVLIGKDLISYDNLFSENIKEVPSHPYSILLSSCRKRESAQIVLLKYKKIGLKTYIVKTENDEKGLWWRVFMGHYRSKKEALRIIKEHNLSGAIVMNTA